MPSRMRTVKDLFKKTIKKVRKVETKKVEFTVLKIGSEGERVKSLQECLNNLGFFCGKVDGIFGKNTEEQVENFQSESNILVDGIVGSGTIHDLDLQLSSLGFPISGLKNSAPHGLIPPSKKFKWIKCPADIFPGRGGYKSLTLRSDTAKAYKDLYDDVQALGGIITTAGGKRSLTSKTSPSRSKKSMHYVGLAFDLALPTGMQDAKKDPYIIEDKGQRSWEVWCRTTDESVPVRTIEASIALTSSGKTKIQKVFETDRFFSFTELADQYGFKPIRARRSFFQGGSYTGAEWWHFQYENALISGQSKFGEELMKVYELSRCEKFHYWNQVKNCIFEVDWF